MSSSSDAKGGKTLVGEALVVTARRDQRELRVFDVEELIDPDHRARMLWAAVEQLDLSAFYAGIKSNREKGGRPALDPKVLLTLWLYAISEGVGSARHVSR